MSVKLEGKNRKKERMIGVRAKERMIERLDRLAKQKGYPDRSKLVRDILKQVIEEHLESEKEG